MFQKIGLKQFGVFENQSFDLQKVTVFYGQNEAGKSTISDALFYALCRPAARKGSYRQLRKRYGDSFDASLRPEPASFIDDDEFKNLYMIRALDFTLALNTKEQWLNELEKRLFTGAVDVQGMIRELKPIAAQDKRNKLIKAFLQLRSDVERLQSELAKLKGERSSILAEEKKVWGFASEKEKIEAKIGTIREQNGRLNQTVELQNRLREKLECEKRLVRLVELEKAKEKIETLRLYEKDESEEVERRMKERESFEKRMIEATSKHDSLIAQIADRQKKLLQLETQFEKQKRLSDAALRYLNRLRDETIPEKIVKQWNRFAIAGATALVAAAGGVPFFMDDFSVQNHLLVVLVTLSAAVALLFGTRRVSIERDEEAVGRHIAHLRSQWNGDTGELLNCESIEEAQRIFTSYRVQYDESQKQYDAQKKELTDRERERIDLETGIAHHKSALERETETIALWFRERRVADQREYLQRVNEFRQLNETRRRLESETGVSDRDFFQLRAELERKLNRFETEELPAESLPEAELKRLMRERDESARKLETLLREERLLGEKKEGLSGELRGRIARIAPELVAREEELALRQRELDGAILEQKASTLALEIFGAVEKNTESRFLALESEIVRYMSDFIPDRSIRLSAMDTDALQMVDRTGMLRSIDQLSTGTKDSVIFCAKIALALKMEQPGTVLVFDEPFLTFDEERELRALKLLRKVVDDRKELQIVFFTKEARLKGRIEEVFDGVRVHSIGK